MSAGRTLAIPAEAVEARRSYASARRAVQGPVVDRPAAGRQGLPGALSYCREQQATAARRVREITAPLGGA